MKNWQFVAIVIAFFLVGFGLSYALFGPKKNDTSAIEAVNNLGIEIRDKRIKDLEKMLIDHETDKKSMLEKLQKDSIHYSKQRSVIIPDTVTIAYEDNIISAGKTLHGPSDQRNTRRAQIASYGSQSVDEVVLLRRIKANQKVSIAIYNGIAKLRDTIIQIQYVTIKEKSDVRNKTPWGWFAIIYAAGILTPK